MRQLQETELFSKYAKKNSDMFFAILNGKVYQGLGDIAPKHIETELLTLKNAAKSKSSYMPFLHDAISLYEQFNGRIRLFNLENAGATHVQVPSFFPFFAGKVKVRSGGDETLNAQTSSAILMNMFRIGHWDETGENYIGLSAKTDLYSCLESGVIMYKLLIEGRSKDVFSNEVILKYLTRIYSGLFSRVLIATAGSSFGMETFKDDAARFLISKFFLLYVLKKAQTELVDDIAYSTIKHFSTLSSLQSFEETSNIDYSSLSGFLTTFSMLFFNKDMSLIAFDSKWAQNYGEGMTLSIEYVPYLIHFLFAVLHGSVLGGSSRLYQQANFLKDDGLVKLYNAMIAELK